MAYLKRKLGEWYREAPRPARKQSAVDADEPAPAAGDQEEATEADAPSGGGDGRGFVLVSKAYRPEFHGPGSTGASAGPGPRSARAA
jgi:hypothetical protein